MKLNGTQQPLAYTIDVNLLTENTNAIKKNTQIVSAGSMEISREVHAKKLSSLLLMSRHQSTKHHHNRPIS